MVCNRLHLMAYSGGAQAESGIRNQLSSIKTQEET